MDSPSQHRGLLALKLAPGWWRDRQGRPAQVLSFEDSRHGGRFLGIAGDRMSAAWGCDGICEASDPSDIDLLAPWEGALPPLAPVRHHSGCPAGDACDCGLNDRAQSIVGV